MFRITFKGQLPDKYIDDHRGMILAAKWRDGELVGRIDIDGDTYDTVAIKAILSKQADPDSKSRNEEGTARVEEVFREYEAWERHQLKLSAKERAQSTSYMNFMSQAIRGRPLTAQEREDVRAAQEEWFTTHPDFTRANPICYFGKEEIYKIPQEKTMRRFGGINAINLSDRMLA